jgi:DNA-binding CsgD family transcriptional regulator
MSTTPLVIPRMVFPPGCPALEVVEGPNTGTAYLLKNTQTPVGRGPDVLQFDAPGVSRRHATFVVSSDRSVTVIDLGSKNRTFVNGVPVRLATLVPGAVVTLGSYVRLRLMYHGDTDYERPDDADEAPRLSPRQMQVAFLVADGFTNAEIARQLSISAKTVARHLENIFAALQIRNRAALASWISATAGQAV